jgi:AcrR family transcriptional regulator
MAEDVTREGAEENVLYRRIIRAAEELFKRSGFRGVTMEAVASAAAVSKATLYSHFRHKEQLFIAVCERMAGLLVAQVAEALATPGASLDERVHAAVVAKHRLTYTTVWTSPHAEDLFSSKAALAGGVFTAADDEMLDLLTAALTEDPALATRAPQLARALFHGGGGLAEHARDVTELEADLDAFVAVHLAGARAVPPPGRRRRR